MPFNAQGLFERLYSWVADRDNGVKIRAERFDASMNDIRDAINAITGNTVPQRGPIRGVYGTAAAPGYAFDDDMDTGLFRPAADQVGISLGGQVALTLEGSKALVGALLTKPYAIGNTGPAVTIDVANGNGQTLTVDQVTTVTLQSPGANQLAQVVLYITNGGAFAVTWPASVNWDRNFAPAFQETGLDIVALQTLDGGTTWHGFTVWRPN